MKAAEELLASGGFIEGNIDDIEGNYETLHRKLYIVFVS